MNEIKIDNLGFLINSISLQLNESDTPRLDSQVLLSEILEKSRSWIISHPEVHLTKDQNKRLSIAMDKLNNGIPLPYILGKWEFYNLEFKINPNVLIPRPETELLVDKAIQWLNSNPKSRHAADIGTGSGCIAISLLVNIPDLFLDATDISSDAISVARSNSKKHNVEERINIYQVDLFTDRKKKYNLITANLPYIPSQTLKDLKIFGKEPTIALDGGPSGFEEINRFLDEGKNHLASGGLMLIEIESNQGNRAIETAKRYFPEAEISLQTDLAGFDRLICIQK